MTYRVLSLTYTKFCCHCIRPIA